jgi:hypothetical protein
MSCYHIIFTKGAKTMSPVNSRDWFLMLRSTNVQKALVKQAREGNTEAKRRLQQFNYSCLPNEDGTLKGATVPSNTVGMDIDHLAPDELKTVQEVCVQEAEKLGILLVERSARGEGLHVVFKRDPSKTQEENLKAMSAQLCVPYDEGAKDITRVFFATTEEPTELLYLNDELFVNEASSSSSPNCGTNDSSSSSPNCGQNTTEGVALHRSAPTTQAQTSAAKADDAPTAELFDDEYKNIPYSDIVEALEDQLGGIPEHGSRNSFIFAMACHLRFICNDNPKWIAQILPDYGEDRQKWFSTIMSSCKRRQNKTMPKVLSKAIAIAEAENAVEEGDDFPPPMPQRLPPLISLLVSKTPKIYRAAVAHAVFPALATHLWRTRFKYIDNVEHEATLMNVLMAGTGAGKSCITAPIDAIMADIRERDAVSMEKERMWKEEINTKGANKDKKARPAGLVIQEVDADMTNAAFVMRLAESDEHFLYVKMNELDQFDALKTSRTKSQFQIMCLAFDPGNKYGQTRVGTQSISERVCIRFNWNACTTIRKGQSYFSGVLTDGPISRINFCTIPEQPIGSPMPKYGKYDEKFYADLKPYIDRLNAARGLIDYRPIFNLAKKLCEENATFSQLCQSRTYENLSFRANVIAFLKANVLYVAQGKWDKTCEDFIRWSERYDLWCKMHFFGEAIDNAFGEEKSSKRRGPQSLLEQLPDKFTWEEACEVRRKNGVSVKKVSVSAMLQTWKQRNYIASDDGKNFTKINNSIQ